MESTDKGNDDARADLDSTGEFFSVGTPLHAVRAGYVNRRADEQLYTALRAGSFAHLVAPDRSGKSSLIAATAARLENNGWKVAILDLAQIGDRDGGTDSGRWYYSVAYRLLRQLRIRYDLLSWWQDKSILSNRQRLVEFYSEVILQHVPEPVVVFVDEIQCIEDLSYADHLLTSIRAAHNARATDPDFTRLSFVLSGECDPVSLMSEAELSPFNVTQQILLDDFSREEIDLFATELNLSGDAAVEALERIYYWTKGQPYLTQKLSRAVAREAPGENIAEFVDRLATRQLAGRAALHSEPQMSHIHRAIVSDKKRREALLNLYGKIRKGIDVPADLGSAIQRRLLAIGLLVIDSDSNLQVRNRLYEAVFTARWANENLPTRLKVPALVVAALFLFAMIPFWYTQWLPNPYVRILTSDSVELENVLESYRNLRSFPGHSDTADNLYRNMLERRAKVSDDESEVLQLASMASSLPSSGRLGDELVASFWDRRVNRAIRVEDRDMALIASLESLELATSLRRQRAASLVGNDYPLLLATLPATEAARVVFDPSALVLTSASGAKISQYSYAGQGVQRREPWPITALEVSPLLRRVIVDREGQVNRIGLSLNISHSRLTDIRIKIIAPSGRTVEVHPGVSRASDNDDIRIPAAQLADLVGESLAGTWSISLRDEVLGVAGQLVGWNLKLNSQGAIEYFQRGLNIPDPVERETDNIWFDNTGRYAVARAAQSDSARVWDLSFAEPIGAVALQDGESLIGLDTTARRLVTTTPDSINIWDTSSGDRLSTLAVGSGSFTAMLTPNGTHLFVRRRGESETELEVWSLDESRKTANITVAGAPSLLAIDSAGRRVAIADFDRAVRVWDLATAGLLGQFDLSAQPGDIKLSADGMTLGVVYPNAGLSLWRVDNPRTPLMEKRGGGVWQLEFSPSGKTVAAGRPAVGFQLFNTEGGRLIGPPVGVRSGASSPDLLAFSQDEQTLLTGSANSELRFWRTPTASVLPVGDTQSGEHRIWTPSADSTILAAPDGSKIVIGDRQGHVHIFRPDATLQDVVAAAQDLSFVGHTGKVERLAIDSSGSMVASVADDNTVRFWKTAGGEPLPHVVEIPGLPATELEFSPSARYLALLNGNRVSIIEVATGNTVAEYDSGSVFSGLAFASDGALYLGSSDGALHLVSNESGASWQLQQVWVGPRAIRLLEASPKGDVLILVDDMNLASEFILAEGRIGEATLQLPSDVREVIFGQNAVRTYFRTVRWVHRASSSVAGLNWMGAALIPPSLNGAGIVYSDGTQRHGSGRKMFLPVARNGFVEFDELNFNGVGVTGLFGNKEELLREWLGRISAAPHEEF